MTILVLTCSLSFSNVAETGEQYMGRLLQVDVRQAVWSLCMWEWKKRRTCEHLRTCQKSTANGVWGMSFPFIFRALVFKNNSRRVRNKLVKQ